MDPWSTITRGEGENKDPWSTITRGEGENKDLHYFIYFWDWFYSHWVTFMRKVRRKIDVLNSPPPYLYETLVYMYIPFLFTTPLQKCGSRVDNDWVILHCRLHNNLATCGCARLAQVGRMKTVKSNWSHKQTRGWETLCCSYMHGLCAEILECDGEGYVTSVVVSQARPNQPQRRLRSVSCCVCIVPSVDRFQYHVSYWKRSTLGLVGSGSRDYSSCWLIQASGVAKDGSMFVPLMSRDLVWVRHYWASIQQVPGQYQWPGYATANLHFRHSAYMHRSNNQCCCSSVN